MSKQTNKQTNKKHMMCQVLNFSSPCDVVIFLAYHYCKTHDKKQYPNYCHKKKIWTTAKRNKAIQDKLVALLYSKKLFALRQ